MPSLVLLNMIVCEETLVHIHHLYHYQNSLVFWLVVIYTLYSPATFDDTTSFLVYMLKADFTVES